MKRLIFILLAVLPALLVAQQPADSIDVSEWHTQEELETMHIAADADTHHHDAARQQIDTTQLTQKEIDRLFWKPDPARAVWLGALVPGMGQIYNRSYWKLPIVYGGFMGCAYAITWNTTRYTGYKNAYRDLYYDMRDGTVTEDPSKSYIAILPEGYTIERMGGVDTYSTRLNEWQNSSRRYRDISILATVIVYALTLVDAYVDAQLFDFDISTDLSLNVSPQLYYDLQNQRTAEVKVAISF